MNEAMLLDIARNSMMVMVKLAAPPLLTSLAVGLIISIFQTVTQIQEQTLTFVPKVIAIFLIILIFLPFMLHSLTDFMHFVLDHAIITE
jgi:flagellar biosynthetic protein FliQ